MMFIGFRLLFVSRMSYFFVPGPAPAPAVAECDKYRLWQNGLLHKFIRFNGGEELKKTHTHSTTKFQSDEQYGALLELWARSVILIYTDTKSKINKKKMTTTLVYIENMSLFFPYENKNRKSRIKKKRN